MSKMFFIFNKFFALGSSEKVVEHHELANNRKGTHVLFSQGYSTLVYHQKSKLARFCTPYSDKVRHIKE